MRRGGYGHGFSRRPSTGAVVSCDVTAADLQASTVQSMLAAATAGQTLCLPAGTQAWSTQVSWTAPANVRLIGAGSLSTIGGGDQTIIEDNYASSSSVFDITVNASGTFRFAGITFRGGSGSVKNDGALLLRGFNPSIRVDHCHFNSQTYSDVNARNGQKLIEVKSYGVLDHNIFDLSYNSAIYVTNGEGDTQGNLTWSEESRHGTENFLYIEDNIVNGLASTSASRILDCINQGSRVVVRFNTLAYVAGPESHATGSSGDNRGCRSKETYGNHFTVLSGAGPAYDLHDAAGGTHLIWGNTADSGALSFGILFHNTRRDNATYGTQSTPERLGFCGTYFWSATVNTSGTAVHATTFPNSAGWVGGSGQNAYTVAANGLININGTQYTIASVTDFDDLVLASSAGTQTGVASYIVSNWDGGPSTDSGYPCLDQTGRGKGDLLTGFLPTLVNHTNGDAGHTSPNAWPRQALEPVYIWDNTTSLGSLYENSTPTVIQADRDYYAQASGIQTNSTTPFDGTTGTGWGTLANRPTSCTTSAESGGGVGYFVTDEGSWRTSVPPEGTHYTGQGRLYKCTEMDTWTPYYTPYTYPHPLNQN